MRDSISVLDADIDKNVEALARQRDIKLSGGAKHDFSDGLNDNSVARMYPLNQILYGAPGTGKTYSSIEYAIAILENRKISEIKNIYKSRRNLMATYTNYVDVGRVVFTTFHQNYGYEDFIQGIRPFPEEGTISFKIQDGVFKIISDKASADLSHNYVIIIDEINRGNISKIFGELITLIEEDKRAGEINQLEVTLPFGGNFKVPNNLYILGTMNSADKSISLIDAALRRRFDFVEIVPQPVLVEDTELRLAMINLNGYIRQELHSPDLLIGHSYFIGKNAGDLPDILNKNIIPLLYEYFYDDESKVAKALSFIKGIAVDFDKNSRIRVKIKVDD